MDVGQLHGHDWEGDVWMERTWSDVGSIDPSWIAALGKGKGMSKGKGKSKSPLSHVQCFSCGQFGHVANSCPSAKSKGKGKPSTIPTCWTCGNRGHVQRDCPYVRQSPWSSMPHYAPMFQHKGKGKQTFKGKGKGTFEVHASATSPVSRIASRRSMPRRTKNSTQSSEAEKLGKSKRHGV